MITIIAGTNRPGANSRNVAHSLLGFYKDAGVQAKILDLADLPPELFLPGAYESKPAAFNSFTDTVLASSGLHVVTPEYNGGFPGVLKYFIDMLPFPESFEGRPVAFTGVAAGMFGALRPVEQLQQLFAYRNAHLYPNRVFIMKVFDVLGDAGEITDAEITERLRKQCEGFASFVEQLQEK